MSFETRTPGAGRHAIRARSFWSGMLWFSIGMVTMLAMVVVRLRGGV